MASVSTDLQWLLVRQGNKYLQKRNGIRLSSDSLNNSGKATKRHAGFIQAKAAVVRMKKDKTIQVYVKDGSAPNKPNKQWVKKDVSKVGQAAATVKAVRGDLTQVGARRCRKLFATTQRIAKVRAATKKHCAGKNHKRTYKRPSRK